jgi:hypothetical protein
MYFSSFSSFTPFLPFLPFCLIVHILHVSGWLDTRYLLHGRWVGVTELIWFVITYHPLYSCRAYTLTLCTLKHGRSLSNSLAGSRSAGTELVMRWPCDYTSTSTYACDLWLDGQWRGFVLHIYMCSVDRITGRSCLYLYNPEMVLCCYNVNICGGSALKEQIYTFRSTYFLGYSWSVSCTFCNRVHAEWP